MIAVIEKTVSRLCDDVCDELEANLLLEPCTLGVDEEFGVVTLTGTVDCLARKIEAVEASEGVRGVVKVVDKIRVVRDPIRGLRDIDLIRASRCALHSHYLFRGDRIRIAVSDGIAALSGRVDSLFEREEAERVIARVPDLLGVRNGIEVASPRVGAERLRASVESSLARRLGDKAPAVSVAVDGQRVTLSGAIPSLEEKIECLRAVSRIHGVGEIRDLVEVDR